MIERINDLYDLWYRSESIENLEKAELEKMLVSQKRSGFVEMISRLFRGIIK